MKQLETKYAAEGISNSWLTEKHSVRKALEAIAHRLPSRRYSPSDVLGVGGSGIVLRLKDSLFPAVDNALKFPRPVEGKVTLVAEMLAKEMTFLSGLRNPGIVKMLFYTTLVSEKPGEDIVPGYQTLPFYLMEAVDGMDSRKFTNSAVISEQSLLEFVQAMAQVINYLHTRPNTQFAHLDIKPENVIADSNGRPVMIDLGTCKRLGSDDHVTLIACTRSYAHPELARLLAKDPSDDRRARGELHRGDIDPRWDLWSFGQTVLSWLGIDAHSGAISANAAVERLTPYTRKYLLLVCARLLTDALPAWLPPKVGLSASFLTQFPINSSDELYDVISRISDARGPHQRIPELAPVTTGSIQAAPGVHVANTERLQTTLSHRLVRRLNSVTQLGVVAQVFPSAKHTRREHSLGTYANAGRIVRALHDDPISPLFKQIISDQDICELLLAALLHDIGQFPLAHDLEEIDSKVFDHDQLTQAMLKGTWTKKKKGSKEILFESLQPVFQAWNTTAERITDILGARPSSTASSSKDKLLRSIINGPIDADKLDYLFRDARHTDVPYPNGVDVERLFRCFTTTVIDRVDGGARDIPALGVHAKGKVAAEFLTLARYAMFSQVYWHHAVRAQKAMLARSVQALLARQSSEARLMDLASRFTEAICALPESLYRYKHANSLPLTKENADEADDDHTSYGPGTDLVATDAAVLGWFYDRLRENSQPEAALIDGILSRAWFKRLWIVSRDMQEKRWDKIMKAWDQLDRQKRYVASFEFEKSIAKKLETRVVPLTAMPAETALEFIQQRTAARQPWLLIDIPGSRSGSEIGLHYVLENQGRRLRRDDRAVGDLQQSSVWDEYAKELRRTAGKIRIFCEPLLADTVDESLKWEEGIDDLAAVLERLTP